MSDHNNQPLGFYADNPDWTSPAAINDDLVARHESKSKYFKPIILALGVGVILGVIGLILRLVDGVSDTSKWGYTAAVLAFLLTTASAAPMVAIAPRIAKGHWRRIISRPAEMWSAAGLISLLLFIPCLLYTSPSPRD